MQALEISNRCNYRHGEILELVINYYRFAGFMQAQNYPANGNRAHKQSLHAQIRKVVVLSAVRAVSQAAHECKHICHAFARADLFDNR